MAIDMCQMLIKASDKSTEAKQMMAKYFSLLSAVICKVVQTSDSWQNKKVKKTGVCVGLYPKAAKMLIAADGDIENPREMIDTQSAKLIKEIEAACEKDKAMSNLKGKIKEIKNLSLV